MSNSCGRSQARQIASVRSRERRPNYGQKSFCSEHACKGALDKSSGGSELFTCAALCTCAFAAATWESARVLLIANTWQLSRPQGVKEAHSQGCSPLTLKWLTDTNALNVGHLVPHKCKETNHFLLLLFLAWINFHIMQNIFDHIVGFADSESCSFLHLKFFQCLFLLF